MTAPVHHVLGSDGKISSVADLIRKYGMDTPVSIKVGTDPILDTLTGEEWINKLVNDAKQEANHRLEHIIEKIEQRKAQE